MTQETEIEIRMKEGQSMVFVLNIKLWSTGT